MIERLKNLDGCARNLLVFSLGIAASLTLAPFFLFPLIIPAYGGLFLVLQGTNSKKRAFADGWWWGWGFFISGLYWFCIALLTDAEKFAWAIPFALFGLTGIIAIYPAIACLAFLTIRNKITTKNSDVISVIIFSAIWLVVEYMRGHLFSGFPWNIAGYSFAFCDAALQLASIIGAYGLTFFTILLASSFTLIRKNLIFPAAIWIIFTATILWGEWRLITAPDGEPTGAILRLVQADIKQAHKWNPLLIQQGIDEHILLSLADDLTGVTHIIWPETAIPYTIRSGDELAKYLGNILPKNTLLITGTMRSETENGHLKLFNSMVAMDSSGAVVGSYDKHALVPFGEFIPLRFLIPSKLKLPVGDLDFSQGNGVQTLKWNGLPPVSPLVCYEAIFPEFAAQSGAERSRPQWLLNITNDAWFGNSSGPYQHFQMARMRAVEQGLPLVRVANTGITAYIDEYGRIKQYLGIGSKGTLDVELRKTTVNKTIYSQINELWP